jgi:hypothetical protein
LAVRLHNFRATDITAYLENGGTIEHAQQIANHESPKTTKLYDRTSEDHAQRGRKDCDLSLDARQWLLLGFNTALAL